MRLLYTGLRVTELERSTSFYGLLGLNTVEKGTMSHGGVYVLLEDPRTTQRLELNWYPPDSPYNSPYVVGEALDHLGVGVEDAERSFRNYVSMGIRSAIEPWTESGGETLAYILDPDGIWVELFSGANASTFGLEYVGIRVLELGWALRLFRDTVGLLEAGRGTMSHGGVWVDLLDPWTMQRLELNWYPKGSRFNWAYEAGEALDHIGLQSDDMESDISKLEALGCHVVDKPRIEAHTEICFLETPQGVWLELLHDTVDQP